MLLILALACKSPADSTPLDTAPEPLSTLSEDPCARVTPGPTGASEGLIELSVAHADIRLFGFAADFPTADAALVAALGSDPPDLHAYAATAGICHLPAGSGALGEASVQQQGGVWWVHPGHGDLSIPDDGAPVAVDLRGLPWTEDLNDALHAAFSAALPVDLRLPNHRIRAWHGYVDQVFSSSNAYSVAQDRIDGELLPAGRSGGALYVLTDGTPSPPAAEWAGAVALGGAGHIVGRSVLSSVAESFWSPLEEGGFLWRGELLLDADGVWPDQIEASLETDSPEAALADLGTLERPARGEATRAVLPARQPYQDSPDTADTEANLRASLLIVHGTLRRFFPYFDVVGDDIDARLLTLYAEPIDPTDRRAHIQRLGRLGAVLHDGHCFFGSYSSSSWVRGYLPVTLDFLDGEPVVVRSVSDEVHAGDTLVAVNGVPIADVLAELRTWHSGATEGYAIDLAGRELLYLDGDTEYTLRDPDGLERTVTQTPASSFGDLAYDLAQRGNGLLSDLGHPEIAYLNMGGDVTTDLSQVSALLSEAADASGLIVDMRDYPGVNHYTVTDALIDGDYLSPIFDTRARYGPDETAIERDQYTRAGSGDFTGPIVLIVSPRTVSAAENFSQMLVGANRLSGVVGRNSAGTNGNITGLKTPGNYYFTFTGMELLNPDGSRFHGAGIAPTVEVVPTAADYRDGREPEILAAIALLSGA